MMKIFGSNRKDGCCRIEGMLSLYIDGRLNAAERNRVNCHIESCSQCRRELQSLEATVQLLRRMPIAAAPRSFALTQAPKRQVASPVGIRIFAWADSAAAAITPSANWLRAATAVAAIALVVMVTGDLTGTLHTDGNSGESISATGQFEEIAAVSGGLATPMPSSDPAGDIIEATLAPEPTQIRVTTDLTDNESTEVGPPPASVDSFPFEGSELSAETPVEDGEAFSWLRPVEISLAILAFMLGCGALWHRQTRRSSAH